MALMFIAWYRSLIVSGRGGVSGKGWADGGGCSGLGLFFGGIGLSFAMMGW